MEIIRMFHPDEPDAIGEVSEASFRLTFEPLGWIRVGDEVPAAEASKPKKEKP